MIDLKQLSWEEKEELEKKRKEESIRIYREGFNPFPECHDRVENKNFSLASVMFTLDMLPDRKRGGKEGYEINGIKVLECNLNPFVIINGKTEYFQRDLVWTLEQKQLLLASIYQNIDCGKILVRKYDWRELEKSKSDVLAFRDIIDGKQRLTTMRDFVHNKFPDANNKYYGQFSKEAQNKLLEHQLFSYAELPEWSTDEQVIRQFLKLNICGVPQSKEHIDFVKSLYSRILHDKHI